MEGADLRSLIAMSRPSVVRSQARASLLNPSRPSTPVSTSRRLFESTVNLSTTAAMSTHAKTPKKKKKRRSSLAAAGGGNEAKYDERSEDEDASESRQERLRRATALQVIKDVQECCKAQDWPRLWGKVDELCSLQFTQDAGSLVQQETRANTLSDLLERAKTSSDPKTTVQLCRLCVRLATDDQKALEEVCELIYAIASDEKQQHGQDDLFRTEKLLEAMIQCLLPLGGSLAKPERYLIFALGSLKFVSADNVDNQRALVQNGIVARLSDLTQALCDCSDSHVAVQILIQATALLRCVVDDKRRIQHFWSAKVVARLCACVERFADQAELMFNCVRILSKLSMSSRVQVSLNIASLVGLCKRHHTRELALCIRVCFVLGNVATQSEAARLEIAGSGGLETLGDMLQLHGSVYLETQSKSKEAREREDLLVKLIRVFANVGLSQKVGPAVLELESASVLVDLVAYLVRLRELSLKQEELMLNCVACITNLTYYGSKLCSTGTVDALLPIVFMENREAMGEAIRALGNFSRLPEMRRCLHERRIDEAMVILLAHEDRDIMMGACGVLTNLVSLRETAELVCELKGVEQLVNLLRWAGVSDPEVSDRVCMVLHNLALLLGSDLGAVAAETTERLRNTLHELSEIASEMEREEAKNEHLVRFATAAQRLLQKLASSTHK